jgi:hypothetical protein
MTARYEHTDCGPNCPACRAAAGESDSVMPPVKHPDAETLAARFNLLLKGLDERLDKWRKPL